MRRHAPPREKSFNSRNRKPSVKRVTLSPEGIERLRPYRPMVGTELGRLDGLVQVQEDHSGAVADYHPDFVEPLREARR